MGDGEWFYAVGGTRQEGPVGWQEMLRLVGEGTVRGKDLVWTEGMAQWTAAREVEALWPAEEPEPPPVQPPPRAPPPGAPPPRGRQPVPYATPVAGDWSPWAIASFVLGLLFIFMLPGPVAVVTGALGVRQARRQGRRGLVLAVIGIILGAFGSILLFLLIVGLVVGEQR